MSNIAKARKTEQIQVTFYFNPNSFHSVCEDAKKAGFRHVLLQEQVPKKNDFSGKKIWQRKGIVKFFKNCWKYWKEHEVERLTKATELARQKKELEEQQRQLGVL